MVNKSKKTRDKEILEFYLKMTANEWMIFIDWLNCWAAFNEHERCLDDKFTIKTKEGLKNNHITSYGEGYNQCISDVMEWINNAQKIKEKE